MIWSEGQTSVLEEIQLDELLTETRKLVLYNDDVNTFDFVIDCLINICKHEVEQAEQCALLVHFKGKAIVKEDSFEKLSVMCEALLDKGLSATVE